MRHRFVGTPASIKERHYELPLNLIGSIDCCSEIGYNFDNFAIAGEIEIHVLSAQDVNSLNLGLIYAC